MRLETFDRGSHVQPEDTASLTRVFRATLDSSGCRLSRLQLRCFPTGHEDEVTCRVRAWQGRGTTLLIEATGATLEDASNAAAEQLVGTLGRRSDSSPGHIPSVERPPQARPVLLVLRGTARRDNALARASRLAASLGTVLRVARLVPSPSHFDQLSPQQRMTGEFDLDRRLEAVETRTWRWCNSRLLTPLAPEQVCARAGNLREQTVLLAREVDACLLVLSSRDLSSSSDAVEIAAEAGRPVLVSRPGRRRTTESSGAGQRTRVVAATDFLREGVPVLRHGIRMSVAMGGELTFVHNVASPSDEALHTSAVAGATPSTRDDLLGPMAERLWRLAGAFGGDVETVVTTDQDPAAAIVRVARERQADLVVVGYHAETGPDVGHGPGVAASVVERAERSVLVVPVEGCVAS